MRPFVARAKTEYLVRIVLCYLSECHGLARAALLYSRISFTERRIPASARACPHTQTVNRRRGRAKPRLAGPGSPYICPYLIANRCAELVLSEAPAPVIPINDEGAIADHLSKGVRVEQAVAADNKPRRNRGQGSGSGSRRRIR
jgi:hypothetical protein